MSDADAIELALRRALPAEYHNVAPELAHALLTLAESAAVLATIPGYRLPLSQLGQPGAILHLDDLVVGVERGAQEQVTLTFSLGGAEGEPIAITFEPRGATSLLNGWRRALKRRPRALVEISSPPARCRSCVLAQCAHPAAR